MVNLTVTDGTDWGFLTAFPCAGSKPGTSNVNYDVGVTRASTAIVALDAAGMLCLELGEASAHIIVDVVSWLGGSGGLEFDTALARVADSRDGTGGWSGTFAAGETRVLDATADLPAGTQVATLGIVSTGSTANGFVQVSPCGTTTETSSLNFVARVDITNLVAAPLAPDGTVCITASAPTHLVVDVFGGFGNGGLLRNLAVGPVEVFPAFDPEQTDYVAYCTSNGANALTVSAQGAPGVTASIVGAGSATGVPVSANRSVAANDAIVVDASLRSGESVEYWVRCVPPDFPHASTNRVAPTTPGWYLVANANFNRDRRARTR